ncbi:unnamed protein product [Rangifer tarandus platyrhynchus]|uniref:Uncharacterized protein n=2 Tax=Rangifer tarandus platyrhynchus TaxID=3082113 RepID=A0ABN8ZMH5_RANTA|nr:unnamed protein product [Rangifer tarandus platyrhynchus]
MSVARGGQFHTTEGNVAGTDVTGLGIGRGQGEATGFRSLLLQRGRVPGRLVDPWESKPGPDFPLQMLTEVQPVLGSRAGWQGFCFHGLGTLVSAAVPSHVHCSGSSSKSGKDRGHREAGSCHSEGRGAGPARARAHTHRANPKRL